ncbi:MAG: thioredoxin family protein [Candidatus Zambryskibacteria bacterium]|nr:thioredoxin family protein [Candidatus Zambryskibacteria bacterium]
MIDSRKYLFAFLITAVIFGTAIFASSVLTDKKLKDVRAIENRVALDILSSETQFALLEETSCRDIGPGFLSKELGSIGEKLSYAESQSGFNTEDLEYLKRSYFLLEIKDYLLMKRLTEKCGIEPTFILYFYSTKDVCEDCARMGYVLTALRDKYPDLRVYSFDYHFDVDAINTLISIYKIKSNLPAFIINKENYYGFHSVEDLEEQVPALRDLALRAKDLEAKATSTLEAN